MYADRSKIAYFCHTPYVFGALIVVISFEFLLKCLAAERVYRVVHCLHDRMFSRFSIGYNTGL